MERHELLLDTIEDLLSLQEVASWAGVRTRFVRHLLVLGLIEATKFGGELRFEPGVVTRIRAIRRLKRDLGINLNGAGVVFELLSRIDYLEKLLPARGEEHVVNLGEE